MIDQKGGCYCGKVRYHTQGEPVFRAECFCRECQYITGGNSLFAMAMPRAGFTLLSGKVKDYSRPDLQNAVTRQFCPDCGTHLFTRTRTSDAIIIIKVGTLDDPSVYNGPQSANFSCDAQGFHNLPDNIPVFQKWMHN